MEVTEKPAPHDIANLEVGSWWRWWWSNKQWISRVDVSVRMVLRRFVPPEMLELGLPLLDVLA